MHRTVLVTRDPDFTWIDVVEPSVEELQLLAEEYDLHATSVRDCLDPEHLPKFERIAGTVFVIVRAWDEAADPDAITVQAATRKVALFLSEGLLLTIHRRPQPYLTRIIEHYTDSRREAHGRVDYRTRVLVDLLNGAVDTYDLPIEAAETALDQFEASLFAAAEEIGPTLKELYHVKRRVLLIRRMLLHTLNVLQRMVPSADTTAPLFHDVRENAEANHNRTEALLEEAESLLNTHLALASHRTNQVVRVLTLFSVFFLPLTFIVGVYGMNFRFMPELEERWGYPAVWGVMLATVLGISLWFRRRGWLKGLFHGGGQH